MITKETTICGISVTLAYCYATEIGFKTLSDEDINDFMTEASEAIKISKMPDVQKTIYLILASMMAYYDQPDKCPVSDVELMKEAAPNDIAAAFGTILNLRAQFYHIPLGEPKDDKKDNDPKNA